MRVRKGYIMILTLAVLAGVVAVLAAAVAMQKVEFQATLNRSAQQRARLMSEAGLQLALNVLASQSTTAANKNDDWYTLGNGGAAHFILSDGSFRMQILDAGQFVNLNTATETQLQNLPLSQEQIDSLLDWRTTGSQPRPQGAKDSFYNSLTYPYNTSEGNLHTVDELLLVNGFTPATLFTAQQGVKSNGVQTQMNVTQTQSYSPILYDLATVDSASSDASGAGGAKLNANTATQQQLTQRGIPPAVATQIVNQRRGRTGTFTTLGAILRLRGVTTGNAPAIINNLTVSTTPPTGKIDLNTADQAVLATIPNLPTDAVQGIIARQANAGFTSLGEIAQVPGMTLNVLAQTVDDFTVNSSAFVVRVIGTAGNTSVPLEAVVTLSNGTARISKISTPPFTDMVPYWHWDPQTNADYDLTGGSSQ